MVDEKDDVLIIEDSPATLILLKDFLNNLGYTKTHSCDHGKLAIDTFKQLIEAKKNPIVLLDYVLPDMDAHSIMTQLLEIKPDVKVILETATEKSDIGVTELIRQGLYQYIAKPIRFENLKKIIETLEKEKQFFEREEQMLDVLKEAEEKVYQHIDFLFKSHKLISLAMLEQYAGAKGDPVYNYLNKLESEGKIVKLEDKKEIACNQCDSVKVIQTFFCPACQKNDFKLTKLIEHFDCGNFSPESDYENNICPKCKKEIKALGVDYRIMQNRYVCNNCREIFQELSSRFFCLKCENRFTLGEASWKTSPFYKALKM